MQQINFTQSEKETWDTITREQKDILTIFFVNYYEMNDGPFTAGLYIDLIDAATYLTREQYIIYRSITQEQKVIIEIAYTKMLMLNEDEMLASYNHEEVYNMDIPFDVYVVYQLFATTDINFKFKFFNN
jgi:hypothetical protein